jgi:hypothetical protein
MNSSSICDQNVFVSKKKKKQKKQKEKKNMMMMMMMMMCFFAFLEHFCKAIFSLHLLAFFGQIERQQQQQHYFAI